MAKRKKQGKKQKVDPFLIREAEKYTNPIASREFILSHLQSRSNPATLKELIEELDIKEEQFEAISRRIKAMLRDGQLEKLKGRRFWPCGKRILIEGKVIVEKGKYKVVPNDGGARIEVTSFNQFPVYSGLKVVVSVPEVPSEIIRQGKIVEVLEGKPKVLTGRFIRDLNFNYVIPHSKEFVHDIFIPDGKDMGAVDGDIVTINLVTKDFKWTEPVGEVVEVLGNENIKGIEIKSAIHGFDIPYEWPKVVETQTSKLKETVPKSAYKNRVDLRDLPLVTIDGEDAKDFDDAVFCKKRKSGGWQLYVAIADVSHYVKPNSALDKEAYVRGNSVYFPGQVVPMLPEVLSNGLCSLKPEVDRLAMICEMSITKEGKVSRYKFYEAVIHSHARLTYTKVFKILNKQSVNLLEKHEALIPHLEELLTLYKALRLEREQRGAIDFDTVETKIIFNKSGKIRKIEPVHRNVAHKIIEECMLAANVSTAKYLNKHKIPGIYRVHEAPQSEKFLDLQTFLYEIGVKYKFGKEPTPLDYGKILRKIRNRKDADIIQMILLRSLSQAVYSPDNVGHFGLAYSSYTHFTSPIRRYPDLIVHRQIKAILNEDWPITSKNKVSKEQKMLDTLEKASEHCSITERRADDATRDVVRWLKCQYIQSHIGDKFEGVIASVTRFGFFVELKDIYIDGLVHITSLKDDYYIFDGIHHKLTGEASRKEYKIGMPVEVIVAKVNLDDRKIDFDLIDSFEKSSKSKKRKDVKPIKKSKEKDLKKQKTSKKVRAQKKSKPKKQLKFKKVKDKPSRPKSKVRFKKTNKSKKK